MLAMPTCAAARRAGGRTSWHTVASMVSKKKVPERRRVSNSCAPCSVLRVALLRNRFSAVGLLLEPSVCDIRLLSTAQGTRLSSNCRALWLHPRAATNSNKPTPSHCSSGRVKRRLCRCRRRRGGHRRRLAGHQQSHLPQLNNQLWIIMERPSRLLRILDCDEDDVTDLYSPNTAPYATRPTRRSLAGMQLQQAGEVDLLELMPSPDGQWIDMVPPESGGGAGGAVRNPPSTLGRRALAGAADPDGDDNNDDDDTPWRVQADEASRPLPAGANVAGSEVRCWFGRGARRLRLWQLQICQSHCAAHACVFADTAPGRLLAQRDAWCQGPPAAAAGPSRYECDLCGGWVAPLTLLRGPQQALACTLMWWESSSALCTGVASAKKWLQTQAKSPAGIRIAAIASPSPAT